MTYINYIFPIATDGIKAIQQIYGYISGSASTYQNVTTQTGSTNTNAPLSWKETFQNVGTAGVQAQGEAIKTIGVVAVLGGLAYLYLK